VGISLSFLNQLTPYSIILKRNNIILHQWPTMPAAVALPPWATVPATSILLSHLQLHDNSRSTIIGQCSFTTWTCARFARPTFTLQLRPPPSSCHHETTTEQQRWQLLHLAPVATPANEQPASLFEPSPERKNDASWASNASSPWAINASSPFAISSEVQ